MLDVRLLVLHLPWLLTLQCRSPAKVTPWIQETVSKELWKLGIFVCGPWFLLVVNRDVSSEDREVEDCSAFPASIPQFRNIYSAIDITFARRRRFLAGESRLHCMIARLVMARYGSLWPAWQHRGSR
jgi:hypothetical protein